MSSQKSSVDGLSMVVAVAPKRERGRLRVAAILDAGAAVIAEKGYEAATMSEIAARSATAIGSLYRFFPTKEVLADALLDRYVGEVTAALAEIRADAPRIGPAGVADALVDVILDLGTERAAVVALVDAKADGPMRRQSLRSAMRDGLAALLRAVSPALDPGQAAIVAPVVLHVMKTAPALMEGAGDEAEARIAELRRLLRLYITDVSRTPT